MKWSFVSVGICAVLLALGPDTRGQDTSELAALNKQVGQLCSQGQYTQALALALKTLKLSKDIFGEETPQTADFLNNVGGIYYNLGDYTNAAAMFVRGLAIREKVLGPEHKFTAVNLINLGALYVKMARYSDAEPLLLRAQAINEKALGPESEATAISLSNLGILYQATGDYAKAESYFKQSLAIRQKVLGLEDPGTITILNNLAVTDIDMGEYLRAEPLLRQVLSDYEKVLGPEHPRVGQSLQTLGTVYSYMGDYAKAEEFYQRALAILEKNPGPDHPDTAVALAALGLLYINMGDYDKALPLCLRASKIEEKVLGPTHPALATTLGELAGIYERAGNFAQAESLKLRVLEIDEKSLGMNHPNTAIAMQNLGFFYDQMGDLQKAESFDKQALSIQEKVLGPNHPNLATFLNNLALVYSKMGAYTNAEPLALRALEIDDHVLAADNPDRANRLENLAALNLDLQKTNDALHYADEAEKSHLGLLDNILSFTSEQERLNYETQVDPYVFFASANDASRLALAILRHKGVVLDSLLEDKLVAEASHNPDDRALIEQLGPAKQKLTQLQMTVPKVLSPDALKARAEERDKFLAQVEQLQGALGRNVAGLGHARRALTVTVEEVQKAIPLRSVLIEFIRYQHYLGVHHWEYRYGAVILASSGAPKWVCLGPAAAIEKNVLLCQQSVRDKEGTILASLSDSLHNLYDQIWQPLTAALPAHTTSIIVSPDASLNFVSFATLLTPEDKFLAEKYSIRYVASGRDLLGEPLKSSNQDMIIFAAPDYRAGGDIDSADTETDLLPLPYFAKNAAELEAEAKPWNWPVQVYSGANATESQVRALHSPRILHFSTHGFFLPKTIGGPARFSFPGLFTDSKGVQQQVTLKNPMYRSGIALAGAQVTLDAWKRGETPPTDTDGILTAEEVGELDLHGTWLVVLSACDTGIGEPRAGEGVMGLRRGFVQAGAQNLLMTLWPVYVEPSGEMMLDFYSTLHQNNNPPEALAKVQRDWLLKLRSRYGLSPAVIMAGAFIVNSQGPIQ